MPVIEIEPFKTKYKKSQESFIKNYLLTKNLHKMEKMNFEQMETVKGGDRYDFACSATCGLFGLCVGVICGGNPFVSWVVGSGMEYFIC